MSTLTFNSMSHHFLILLSRFCETLRSLCWLLKFNSHRSIIIRFVIPISQLIFLRNWKNFNFLSNAWKDCLESSRYLLRELMFSHMETLTTSTKDGRMRRNWNIMGKAFTQQGFSKLYHWYYGLNYSLCYLVISLAKHYFLFKGLSRMEKKKSNDLTQGSKNLYKSSRKCSLEVCLGNNINKKFFVVFRITLGKN